MKNSKRTPETPVKDIIHKLFMENPLPMFITKAKDGTYVEVNKAAVKYWGMSRKQIIGQQSTALGVYSGKYRNFLMKEIRKNGFARNVIVEHQGLFVLFVMYPLKVGKELFLLSAATDVCNQKTFLEKFKDDPVIRFTVHDHQFIKAKLKPYPLTNRQQEIAILSTIGQSNKEIARTLELSEFTVKDHMKEIYKTLGIKNRVELFPKLLNLR